MSANRMGRTTLGVLVPLLLGLITTGCGGKTASTAKSSSEPDEASAPPVFVTVAPVTVRRVRRKIPAVGTLHGFERVTVTPKVEGRIKSVRFEIGDRVPPDATLLELDELDYDLAVNETQRALEQELARLGLSDLPSADFDIEKLPAVERSRLILENAERRFDRERALYQKNAGTRETYEQAETDVKVALAGLRQTRLEAKATLAAVRFRESQLAVARQRLSEVVVRAPKLGTLDLPELPTRDYAVARRMASVGEMVRAFPSTPVCELVVDDVLKLKALLPERYLRDVRVGLEAEVRVDAYPNEVFRARIARRTPTIDPQNRTFGIEAHVPNSDHRLLDGGFAKVEIIAGDDDEALTVPIESVTTFAGVTKLFRVRKDVAEEVVVQAVFQGEGWIEVTGPLQADEQVVTSGQRELSDGRRVTIRAASDSATKRSQESAVETP